MSKYDQLDYISQYEKINKTYPDCVKNLSNKNDFTIPEELLQGITVENFKKCLNLESEELRRKFMFFNNNQTMISDDYFKNARYLSNEMSEEKKKDYIIEYILYYFGDKIDGELMQNKLQDIFNLRNKNFDKDDYDFMIQNYFKKNLIDLNDNEDLIKFKEIIQVEGGNYNFNNFINNSKEFEINTKE